MRIPLAEERMVCPRVHASRRVKVPSSQAFIDQSRPKNCVAKKEVEHRKTNDRLCKGAFPVPPAGMPATESRHSR